APYAITASPAKLGLLISGALLSLVCVVAALWWSLRKAGNENTIDSGQQTTSPGAQPATPDRNPTVKPSASQAPVESPAADNRLWALISEQTIDVADKAFALAADRQMAVIKPGGQLALSYRGGQFFGDGNGPDLRVHGPEQGQVSYIIFVRNNPAEGWQR